MWFCLSHVGFFLGWHFLKDQKQNSFMPTIFYNVFCFYSIHQNILECFFIDTHYLSSFSTDNWSHHHRPCSRPHRGQKLHQPHLWRLRLHQHQRVDEGWSASLPQWPSELLHGQQHSAHKACSKHQPWHLPMQSQQPGQHHHSSL